MVCGFSVWNEIIITFTMITILSMIFIFAGITMNFEV